MQHNEMLAALLWVFGRHNGSVPFGVSTLTEFSASDGGHFCILYGTPEDVVSFRLSYGASQTLASSARYCFFRQLIRFRTNHGTTTWLSIEDVYCIETAHTWTS